MNPITIAVPDDMVKPLAQIIRALQSGTPFTLKPLSVAQYEHEESVARHAAEKDNWQLIQNVIDRDRSSFDIDKAAREKEIRDNDVITRHQRDAGADARVRAQASDQAAFYKMYKGE